MLTASVGWGAGAIAEVPSALSAFSAGGAPSIAGITKGMSLR